MEFDNIIYTMLDILHFAYHFKKDIQISFYLRKIILIWKICTKLTIVRKIPNSGLRSTTSPSVKMNYFLRSFLAVRTMAICCAATDSTGRSIRLNSSKHPHDPDCANPGKYHKIHSFRCDEKMNFMAWILTTVTIFYTFSAFVWAFREDAGRCIAGDCF